MNESFGRSLNPFQAMKMKKFQCGQLQKVKMPSIKMRNRFEIGWIITFLRDNSINNYQITKVNSRGPIVLLKDGLVLQVTETSDNHKENWWNLHVSCKILSAFHSYRYFKNLTLLSVIYSLKTRGRSAFFREIYNLSTFITYEMKWNFYT